MRAGLVPGIAALAIAGTTPAAAQLQESAAIVAKAGETLFSTGNIAIAALVLTNAVAWVIVFYLLRTISSMSKEDTEALKESNGMFVDAVRLNAAEMSKLSASVVEKGQITQQNMNKLYEAIVALKDTLVSGLAGVKDTVVAEATHTREVVRDREAERPSPPRKSRPT